MENITADMTAANTTMKKMNHTTTEAKMPNDQTDRQEAKL